jgi:phosphoglycolate phosphatase
MTATIQGVLFDLDGTLLDTAPDMGGALNELRAEQGLAPLPQPLIRPHVSKGAAALIDLGFGSLSSTERSARLTRFLALYRNRIALETKAFEQMPELLSVLEQRGIAWGVVTNKLSWLAQPLLEALNLASRASIIVCGDTLAERKPSPLPLLHAAERLGVAAAECLFLGDAECDMQAAAAAGMIGIGAKYGYIEPGDGPARWPARGWIDSPIALLEWIEPKRLRAKMSTST